jgi:parvulin-like peptidyl-prolyl isomerase
VQYFQITYKGARSPIDIPYYDREGAEKVAQQLADLARGKTIPAFEQAAFALSVNGISDVAPTPAGYQIIKRVE